MHTAAAEKSFWTSRNSELEQEGLSELFATRYEGKRLASFRRVLTALMIVTGAPVLALARAEGPAVKKVVMVLALVWLCMLPPMIRLLWTEWHVRRAADRLSDLVHERPKGTPVG